MHPDFFEIRIENTNACGYRCVMCPREKQTRKIGFMPLEDFKLILDKTPQKEVELHLHGYGEPLLDKQLAAKVALATERNYTTFIISTLGVELTDEDFEAIVDAGLNTLIISFYGFTRSSYKKIHKVDKLELVKKNLRTLAETCRRKKAKLIRSIKIQSPTVTNQLTTFGGQLSEEWSARLEFENEMRNLGYGIQSMPGWHNYGNGRDYRQPNANTLCPVVRGNRSKILNITWDLNVIPCSFDFNSSIKFGNLRTQTLEEIFESEAYKTFIIRQLCRDLSPYPVCQGCDKLDYGKVS